MLAYAVPQIAQSYSCAPGASSLVPSQPVEECTLNATINGPLDALLEITGERGETITLYRSQPGLFINGVAQFTGNGAGPSQVTVPYFLPIATSRADAAQLTGTPVRNVSTVRWLYGWTIELPIGARVPHMQVVVLRNSHPAPRPCGLGMS